MPKVTTADLASAVVLKNNVVFGSVNANKRHWYKAAEALARADRSWLGRLITKRERPENFQQALARTFGRHQGRHSVLRGVTEERMSHFDRDRDGLFHRMSQSEHTLL